MEPRRERIRFFGKVQHVGFRYIARTTGEDLGLTGWVRNEQDKSVTMEAQGSLDAIERLLERLEHDTYIRIEHLEREVIALKEGEKGFVTRRFR